MEEGNGKGECAKGENAGNIPMACKADGDVHGYPGEWRSDGGVAKPLDVMKGDFGYGELKPGTGMSGGGTGKCVKLGWCAELPELGVMEMVDGR